LQLLENYGLLWRKFFIRNRPKGMRMKRSEINQAISLAKKALEDIHFKLPEFSEWSKKEWEEHDKELGTIKKVMLGWDVSDYGSDDFANCGCVLFTIRNGDLYHPETGVPYCEKVLVFNDAVKQIIPFHFHRLKTEDIINRGNGMMEIELFNSTADGKMDKTSEVKVFMDGIEHTLIPGKVYDISPGSSITLTPGLYHRFGCRPGAGNLVCGEVSKINDDNTDNIFAEKQIRFSDIVEDEEPLHPLCNEIAKM